MVEVVFVLYILVNLCAIFLSLITFCEDNICSPSIEHLLPKNSTTLNFKKYVSQITMGHIAFNLFLFPQAIFSIIVAGVIISLLIFTRWITPILANKPFKD